MLETDCSELIEEPRVPCDGGVSEVGLVHRDATWSSSCVGGHDTTHLASSQVVPQLHGKKLVVGQDEGRRRFEGVVMGVACGLCRGVDCTSRWHRVAPFLGTSLVRHPVIFVRVGTAWPRARFVDERFCWC